MSFLAAEPDITPITNLITTWIHISQALVGSVGARVLPFGVHVKNTAVQARKRCRTAWRLPQALDTAPALRSYEK